MDHLESPADDAMTAEELHRFYEARGASTHFLARPLTLVECQKCDEEAEARPEILEDARHVLGGGQDAVVALVRCPSCDVRGTLTIGKGPSAPTEEAAVLQALLAEPA